MSFIQEIVKKLLGSTQISYKKNHVSIGKLYEFWIITTEQNTRIGHYFQVFYSCIQIHFSR